MGNIIEITQFSAPELDVYARLSEPRLLHINEPQQGIFIAESPNVIMRALDAGYEPVSLLVESGDVYKEAAGIIDRCGDIPVYTASLDVLVKITGFQLTRGLLCAMRRRELKDASELIKEAKNIAVLEGVVNPTNIGAIFRSAAALNIDAVILSPDCADPLYRRSSRVSMGTVFQVPWTYMCKSVSDWESNGITRIKELGYTAIGMALSDKSLSISDKVFKECEKKAIFLGSEGDGLSNNTLNNCDYLCIIPMKHNVDSLNVAAASAVAFWELCHD